MSVNKATVGVIAVSATTLLLCLFAMSKIYNDIQNIWIELDNEIDMFKVIKKFHNFFKEIKCQKIFFLNLGNYGWFMEKYAYNGSWNSIKSTKTSSL